MPRNLKTVRRTGRVSRFSGQVRRVWFRVAGRLLSGEGSDHRLAEHPGLGQTDTAGRPRQRVLAGGKKGENE